MTFELTTDTNKREIKGNLERSKHWAARLAKAHKDKAFLVLTPCQRGFYPIVVEGSPWAEQICAEPIPEPLFWFGWNEQIGHVVYDEIIQHQIQTP